MDCPRCGAPNLPGLRACVDCGQGLDAEPEVPENLVPRVAVANPLAERRTKPARPARRRLSAFAHVGRLRHLPVEAFWAALVGLVKGSIPGLMPALRRDRRGAAIQIGAVLLPLLVLLLWGGLEALGRFSFLVAMGWSLSPASEARRAMDTPEPYRTSAAWLLALGPTMAFALALRFLLAPVPPMTFHFTPEGSLLPGRSCRVVPLRDAHLVRGALVAFDRSDVAERLAWLEVHVEEGGLGALATYERYLRQYPYFASPVVALPGDVLSQGGRGIRVDGAPSEALPIASWPREPLAQDLQGLPVPEGQVAVWDWVPYPIRTSLHLVLIPRDRVLGTVSQYSTLERTWVDLHWPGDAVGPSQNPEPP